MMRIFSEIQRIFVTFMAGDWDDINIPWLGFFGTALWLGGLFILIFDPSGQLFQGLADSSGSRGPQGMLQAGPDVISFQMIFIGLALTISGAIFIAAQWRPVSPPR